MIGWLGAAVVACAPTSSPRQAAPRPIAEPPPLDAVDRLCPGAAVTVSKGPADLDSLRASLRLYEPSANGFTFHLREVLDPDTFFARYGPLLGLGPQDALHPWPMTGPSLGYGLCHDGVRVAGAGVTLSASGPGVLGGSVILYDLDVPGAPALTPAEAHAVALLAMPELAGCDDWTLLFDRAPVASDLVYACRYAPGRWASFSALTGEIVGTRTTRPR